MVSNKVAKNIRSLVAQNTRMPFDVDMRNCDKEGQTPGNTGGHCFDDGLRARSSSSEYRVGDYGGIVAEDYFPQETDTGTVGKEQRERPT